MPVILGGGRGQGNIRPARPQNTGMAPRARRRLEAVADAMVSQRQTSIEVDGTQFVAWRKQLPGSKPCSCSAAGPSKAEGGVTLGGRTPPPLPALEDFKPPTPGDGLIRGGSASLDDYRVSNTRNPNPWSTRANIEPELDADDEFSRVEMPDGETSDIDQGSADLLVPGGGFAAGSIVCGLCYGAGYTDAWKPFKATRILGDFNSRTDWTPTGSAKLNNDAEPNTMHLGKEGSITWNLYIPRYFDRTLRIQVWNNSKPLSVTPQIYLNNTWVDATPGRIDTLNNNNGGGQSIPFRVVSKGNLIFTHLEIIVALERIPLASVPMLDIPYDAEYIDYNTTMNSVDMPIDTDLQQGDIISERKHGRLWQATSVQKNSLANDKVIDLTVDFRAINSTEVYYGMNVFRRKRD